MNIKNCLINITVCVGKVKKTKTISLINFLNSEINVIQILKENISINWVLIGCNKIKSKQIGNNDFIRVNRVITILKIAYIT